MRIFDHSRSPDTAAVTVQDSLLEAERSEKEALFRVLFDSSRDPWLLVDAEGVIVDSNPALCDWCGHAQDELRGRPAVRLLQLPGLERLTSWGAFLAQASDEPLLETAAELRVDLLCRTGRRTDLMGRSTPVPYQGQRHLLFTLHDREGSGERVTMHTLARRGAAELTAVIEQIPAGVFIGDSTGIKACNTQALEILGFSSLAELDQHRAHAHPSPGHDAATGEPIPPAEEPFALALRGERSMRDIVYRHSRTGAEVILHCAAAPVIEEDRVVGAVAIYADATERRRAEEELRRAQKNEAVGRLAGGIAHDFNNIMMGILGYIHLLLEAIPAGDPRRDDVQAIAELTQRAAALTSQLLAFARRQVLRPQRLDANTVLLDLERMVRPLIRADIEFALRLEPGPTHVVVDRGQLEQVLFTLILNGRDAMPTGGRLTVVSEIVTLRHPIASAIEGATFRPGRHVRIAVTDTGLGLSRDARLRIFEPFAHERGATKDGLGLASVLGIIQQSGGFLTVDSAPGAGSTFSAYLPEHAEPEGRSAERTNTPAPAAGTETLLVAEDEEAVRQVVARSLRVRGYTVLEARNGGEALHLLQHAGPVDLVITDLVMPVMGGRELMQAVARLNPSLPVVLMSGHSDDEVIRREIAEGRAPYLQKPFRPDTLARLVREILDARREPG